MVYVSYLLIDLTYKHRTFTKGSDDFRYDSGYPLENMKVEGIDLRNKGLWLIFINSFFYKVTTYIHSFYK